MKTNFLILFLLISLASPGQDLGYGFEVENNSIIWQCHYEGDATKDGLIAVLGANPFVRLSPIQPEGKIVGRVEGMPSKFKGLDASIGWTYDFGFVVTLIDGGYIVKGTNFVGKTNAGHLGGSGANTMSAEEWLGGNGKSRQKKWAEANGIPATRIFQVQ